MKLIVGGNRLLKLIVGAIVKSGQEQACLSGEVVVVKKKSFLSYDLYKQSGHF